MWSVAGNDGNWQVLDVAPGQGRRVDGEGERVGAVTETAVALVARAERSPLADSLGYLANHTPPLSEGTELHT